jgi:hypothetical protein
LFLVYLIAQNPVFWPLLLVHILLFPNAARPRSLYRMSAIR